MNKKGKCQKMNVAINSLTPVSGSNYKSLIVKLIELTDILSTSCKGTDWWMLQNSIDNKFTLVQIMVWCQHKIQ